MSATKEALMLEQESFDDTEYTLPKVTLSSVDNTYVGTSKDSTRWNPNGYSFGGRVSLPSDDVERW